MPEKKYWLIGHKEDFDWIIIGENTGPYTDFPKTHEEARIAKGELHYIDNFVSQINGKKVRTSSDSIISKCPALDDWNKNVREPDKSFSSIEKIVEYLKEESRPIARTVYLRKCYEDSGFLERFSIEGLTPN